MPAPRIALLLSALLFAVLIAACGGDDNGDESTPTATRSPTASRVTDGASPDGDEKTPGPSESPGEGTPLDTGTPEPTRAPVGTPAVAPADQSEYLDQFSGSSITYEECVFNPSTYVTDCPSRGKFAVDPPLGGQDVTCRLGLVDGTPEFITCQSQEPLQSIYYEIQG